MERNQVYTIQQIDAMKGIRTPHERDLIDLGKKYVQLFQKLDAKDIESIIASIGGIYGSLDFGELWTITKEIFPEVRIHLLLQYDDEGLSSYPYELKFLFSGTNVIMISGEDLCLLCEILVNYSVFTITGQFPQDIYPGTPSLLLSKALDIRTLNWDIISLDHELKSYFMFRPFPGLNIKYNIALIPTGFLIESQKLHEFWIYDVERLVIIGLNQILRLVKIRLGLDAPAICNMMFSGYYKKMHPRQFP